MRKPKPAIIIDNAQLWRRESMLNMSELSIKIGKLIRNEMNRVKHDSRVLGLQCSIDRSYMGRIECGEVNLTVEKNYMEIAKILRFNLNTYYRTFRKLII